MKVYPSALPSPEGLLASGVWCLLPTAVGISQPPATAQRKSCLPWESRPHGGWKQVNMGLPPASSGEDLILPLILFLNKALNFFC